MDPEPGFGSDLPISDLSFRALPLLCCFQPVSGTQLPIVEDGS